MLGLAIESAGRSASAALWRSGADGGVIAKDALSPEAGKADQLILLIERLLGGQGLTYDDLDVIAVNRGPGSFTGIRSAVALARGLALAADLPVLGVTSHEALAARIGRDAAGHSLLIALDARRGEVYAAAFSAEGAMSAEIAARSPKAAAAMLDGGRWRLAGSGAHLVAEALDGGAEVEMIETQSIDATAVALAAARRLAGGETPGQGFAVRPLYVRAPDAVPSPPLISESRPLEGSI